MAKSAIINVRVEPQIKALAEDLYRSFGISLTDAINIFLTKSITEGALPFELRQPRYNKETEEAFKEADAIIEGRLESKAYSSVKELFNELDSEIE